MKCVYCDLTSKWPHALKFLQNLALPVPGKTGWRIMYMYVFKELKAYCHMENGRKPVHMN